MPSSGLERLVLREYWGGGCTPAQWALAHSSAVLSAGRLGGKVGPHPEGGLTGGVPRSRNLGAANRAPSQHLPSSHCQQAPARPRPPAPQLPRGTQATLSDTARGPRAGAPSPSIWLPVSHRAPALWSPLSQQVSERATGCPHREQRTAGAWPQAHREEALLLGGGRLQPAVLCLRVLHLLDAGPQQLVLQQGRVSQAVCGHQAWERLGRGRTRHRVGVKGGVWGSDC